MLKPRNLESMPPRQRPRKGYGEVMELPQPISETDRRSLDRLVNQAAAEVIRQFNNVVERALDNAKLNDIYLRAAMRFPESVQANPRAFKAELQRIIDQSNAILEASGEPHGRRREFIDSLERLTLSVAQISRFVRESRGKNADFRFATSVWMDAYYGIDLLRAWPIWVPEKNALDIFVTGYQAKASSGGLEATQIRDLVTQYAPKKALAERDLAFDPAWVQEAAMEPLADLTGNQLDSALRDLARARKLLARMTNPGTTPFDKWRAEYVRSQLAGQFADALGLERTPGPAIRQRGTGLNLRFVVDTREGLKDLTEEVAKSYGQAA